MMAATKVRKKREAGRRICIPVFNAT